MDPVAKPLIFRQGDRVNFTATIRRGGELVDLTGWQFESHLRKVPRGAILASFDPEIVSLGIVRFSLSRETSLGLPATPPETFWGTDGWAIEPDGTPHALPRRDVTISATYTHE